MKNAIIITTSRENSVKTLKLINTTLSSLGQVKREWREFYDGVVYENLEKSYVSKALIVELDKEKVTFTFTEELADALFGIGDEAGTLIGVIGPMVLSITNILKMSKIGKKFKVFEKLFKNDKEFTETKSSLNQSTKMSIDK